MSVLSVGNSAVGKTAILKKYLENVFNQEMASTIGKEYFVLKRDFVFDGKTVPIKAKIWDSSGQERFKNLVASAAKNTQGIFFVYDMTFEKSFQDLKEWIDSVNKVKDNNTTGFPFIILANKVDLEEERKISHEEGKAFADKLKIPYFETSAKTGQGLQEAFQCLFESVYKTTKGKPSGNIAIS